MTKFSQYHIVTIVRAAGTSNEQRYGNVRAGGTLDVRAFFHSDTDIKRGDAIHANCLDEPRVVTAIHPKTVLSGELAHYEVELMPLSKYSEQRTYSMHSPEKIFEFKPTFHGMGINLNALFKRILQKFFKR